MGADPLPKHPLVIGRVVLETAPTARIQVATAPTVHVCPPTRLDPALKADLLAFVKVRLWSDDDGCCVECVARWAHTPTCEGAALLARLEAHP